MPSTMTKGTSRNTRSCASHAASPAGRLGVVSASAATSRANPYSKVSR